MPNDTHKQLTTVIVFKGKFELEDLISEFPGNFLEKMFGSFTKFYSCEKIFQELKLIIDPTKKDIDRLWQLISQIDPDFYTINTCEGFKQALKENFTFADFCLKQDTDFQFKLIEYLANWWGLAQK